MSVRFYDFCDLELLKPELTDLVSLLSSCCLLLLASALVGFIFFFRKMFSFRLSGFDCIAYFKLLICCWLSFKMFFIGFAVAFGSDWWERIDRWRLFDRSPERERADCFFGSALLFLVGFVLCLVSCSRSWILSARDFWDKVWSSGARAAFNWRFLNVSKFSAWVASFLSSNSCCRFSRLMLMHPLLRAEPPDGPRLSWLLYVSGRRSTLCLNCSLRSWLFLSCSYITRSSFDVRRRFVLRWALMSAFLADFFGEVLVFWFLSWFGWSCF